MASTKLKRPADPARQVSTTSEIIRGRIAQFFHRKDDGWCIVYFERDTDSEMIKVTGVFPESVAEGDTVELVGQYTTTEKFGDQFKATAMLSCLPGNAAAIEAWLTFTLPNIGPARAAALVQRFGSSLWSTIEHRPSALTAVEGITDARAQELITAYAQVRGARDHVLQLTAAGLTVGDASRLLAELGSNAFVVLADDPWTAMTRRRIPFALADAVAMKLFAPAPADPRRVRAFALRTLTEHTYLEGHCYMMLFELVRTTSSMLKIKDEAVVAALVDYGELVQHGKRVMLLPIDEAEQTVALVVRRLLGVA